MIFHESNVLNTCQPGEDVVGCSAPIVFDIFVHGYFGALGGGLTLSLDMKCLTTFIGTPSVAGIFLSDKKNNVRVMSVAGEACIATGEVKNETMNWSIRKYAAYEELPEVIVEQQACVDRCVEMLGDTPPRLEVDFAVPNSSHQQHHAGQWHEGCA